MDDAMSVFQWVLPWTLVIEALAGIKEIDTSIIRGLIDISPLESDDITETTRELVAFKCLEDMFGAGSGSTLDDGSKIGFDFSRSCAGVLHQIMKEASLTSLKRARSELLNFDLYPFIAHKRATFGKCALQQLKEAILEFGALPGVNHSKKKSVLTFTSDGNGVQVNAERGDCNSEKEQMETLTEQLPAKEVNQVPAALGDGSEKMLKANLLPFERIGIDTRAGNLIEQYHENQHDASERNPTTADEIKHCATSDIESRKDNEVRLSESERPEISCTELPFAGIGDDKTQKDLVENLERGSGAETDNHEDTAPLSYHEKMVPGMACSDAGNRETKGNSQPAILEDCNRQTREAKVLPHKRIRIDSDDENVVGNFPAKQQRTYEYDIASAKKIKHCATSEESKKENESHVHESNVTENVGHVSLNQTENYVTRDDSLSNISPKAASLDKVEQATVRDEAENDANHCCEEGQSSDSGGFNNEEINLATKKNEFLSSQCTSGNDFSSRGGWSEQNRCMKCNEGGQLLICSSNTCPLVLHANCLGTEVEFDAVGNFYCPFCVYSRDISDYLEAKRKTSLARKYLVTFLQKCTDLQPKDVINASTRKAHISSRDSLPDSFHKKSNETEVLPRKENGEDRHSEQVHEVNDDPLLKNRQMEPSASCDNVNSSHEKEGTRVYRVIHMGGSGEKASEDTQSVRESEVRQVPVNYEDGADKYLPERANVVSPLEPHREKEVQQDLLKPETAILSEPASVHDMESEEVSNGENKPVDAARSRRSAKKAKRQQYPSSPQFRRKKVPWTAEEEEILKMGVEKFSSVHDRGFPWKKVLDFGAHVFSKSRTAVDLKDKWRNMCKASSKSN